jgi:hypothetical protein
MRRVKCWALRGASPSPSRCAAVSAMVDAKTLLNVGDGEHLYSDGLPPFAEQPTVESGSLLSNDHHLHYRCVRRRLAVRDTPERQIGSDLERKLLPDSDVCFPGALARLLGAADLGVSLARARLNRQASQGIRIPRVFLPWVERSLSLACEPDECVHAPRGAEPRLRSASRTATVRWPWPARR